MSDLNKILYVEDDLDIQTVAQMALEAVGGFELKICSSGSEALDAAPAFAPDLILLDVQMPGMDGPTTMKNLRAHEDFSETPVVFMTAKVMPSDIESYKSLGAVDVISKPFDPMTLSEQIREIWNAAHG